MSDAGRLAELGDYAARTLGELGRHDAILEKAQQQLAELIAEGRKVPLDLSPAQMQLVPSIYARLAETEPLELPARLAEAVERV